MKVMLIIFIMLFNTVVFKRHYSRKRATRTIVVVVWSSMSSGEVEEMIKKEVGTCRNKIHERSRDDFFVV